MVTLNTEVQGVRRLRRSLIRAVILTAGLVGCARHTPHSPKPAVVGPRTATPVTPPNPRVFAADGMCSDRLAEHHRGLIRIHGLILGTMRKRLETYRKARGRIKYSRYLPNPRSEERAAEKLKEVYAGWFDVYRPYHEHYGDYVCVRREDFRPISSSEFSQGLDEIWATVKHLGELPPPVVYTPDY